MKLIKNLFPSFVLLLMSMPTNAQGLKIIS